MIKHEFPIYIRPRTCRWPASTWFPFLQQSLTQRYKIHSMFNLKMKWSCERLVHSASQRPQGPSLSQFRFPLKSHWTVSVASRAKKSSELIPFDQSFLPISTERTMISWCCLLPFKSCKYWLTPLLISLVVLTFYYELKLLSPSFLWNWV